MGTEKKGTVLIVEDDMLLSMVEERLIKQLDYEVVGKVDNGSDAIDKVSELNPDILVMDISLKGDLDGVETMHQLRKNSSVPVIYLSGSADRYQKERAKKTGYIEFLTKPVTAVDLKEPLSDALAQRRGKKSDQQLNKAG